MNPLSSAPRLLLVSANTAMYSFIANLLADQPYQLPHGESETTVTIH